MATAKAVELAVDSLQFSAAGLSARFFFVLSVEEGVWSVANEINRLCSCFYSCMHESMKTITLDEEAYGLLKMWKTSHKESFSKVVKRVVPVPGTLGALLSYVEEAGTSRLPGNEVLEASVNLRPNAKHDPWS